MKLKQKATSWALILGGSSGLGLATAKKLAKHGYAIIIVHRDRRAEEQRLAIAFNEIKSFGNQLLTYNVDALNPEKRTYIIDDIKQHLADDDTIQVLVHSIAKGSLKPMYSQNSSTLTATDFSLTLTAMALSLYEWTKALMEGNLFAADTRIISFTSEGATKALPNYAAVSVAKVALEALTRSIALEFAPLGIKANCIQAGVTDTPALQQIPGYERIIKHALARNPSKRLTLPEDVANAVYLLTMPEAKWITGTIIKVDGGESLL